MNNHPKKRLRISIRTVLELVAVIAVILAFTAKNSPRLIQPQSLIQIRVAGTLPSQPIDGYFLVDDDGSVALGPSYGYVNVLGLSAQAAAKKIEEKLAEVLQAAEASVVVVGEAKDWMNNSLVQELEGRIRELEIQNAKQQERWENTDVVRKRLQVLESP